MPWQYYYYNQWAEVSSLAKNGLCWANFNFKGFWALPGDFWSPNEIVSYETYVIFEKHLGEMLFAQNTSKNINIFWSVEA